MKLHPNARSVAILSLPMLLIAARNGHLDSSTWDARDSSVVGDAEPARYLVVLEVPAECLCAQDVDYDIHDLEVACESMGFPLYCLLFDFNETSVGLNQDGGCVGDVPAQGQPDERVCKGWTPWQCGFVNWDVEITYKDWEECDESTSCCASSMKIYDPDGQFYKNLSLGGTETYTILPSGMDCGQADKTYSVDVKCGTTSKGQGRLVTECDQCTAKQ